MPKRYIRGEDVLEDHVEHLPHCIAGTHEEFTQSDMIDWCTQKFGAEFVQDDGVDGRYWFVYESGVWMWLPWTDFDKVAFFFHHEQHATAYRLRYGGEYHTSRKFLSLDWISTT